MTRESYIGLGLLMALFIGVPTGFLLIKATLHALLFMFNHPLPVVGFSLGALTGSYLKSRK